MPMTTVKVQ